MNKFFNHKPFIITAAAVLSVGILWAFLGEKAWVGNVSTVLIGIGIAYLTYKMIKK